MQNIRKLYYDFKRLVRVCGLGVAFNWLKLIIYNYKKIGVNKNLSIADNKMGDGPFKVRFDRNTRFIVAGPSIISSIREMYCRDVYLGRGQLQIKPNTTIIDLGANVGNFTTLALATHKSVRVISIEPSKVLNYYQENNLKLNKGFSKRATIVNASIGKNLDNRLPSCAALTEEDLISQFSLNAIGFLKCDIEGAEYDLFKAKSKLLSITEQLAIEIHSFAGEPCLLINAIKQQGFIIKNEEWDAEGNCTVRAQKLGANSIS
jgi:FkbM family methyltransferase